MTLPVVPAPYPRRDSAVLRALGRLLLRLMGWRIEGKVPPVPRFVAIVAPHTSNWDFIVGVAVMFALDLRINWFGKDTLFRGPFGTLLRGLGGRPVKRHMREGTVAQAVLAMRAEPRFILALSPEGTRKPVTRWRTGFYRIAEGAEVPILPVWFDWSRRVAGLGTPMRPTGDMEGDIERLQAHYDPSMARFPRRFVTGRSHSLLDHPHPQ